MKRTSQDVFEVRCHRCDVSFPAGTKRCMYCGGKPSAGPPGVEPLDLRTVEQQAQSIVFERTHPAGLPQEAPVDEEEVEPELTLRQALPRVAMSLVWVALLGGAVAFRTKAHLGVDYFANQLHPDARKLTAVVAHLVVLFFAVAVLLLGGASVVREALALEQTTPALGWKMGYVYLALPISGFFMALYTVDNLMETLRARPEGRGAEGKGSWRRLP